MENNLLKVRMFGGFSLEFNDKEVVFGPKCSFQNYAAFAVDTITFTRRRYL